MTLTLTPDAIAPSASIPTLPLFCLVLSGLNVRRTERDADIASLADDIAARGLKQNLVVVPAHFSTAETEDNFGDRFEVVAGGRRLQALQLLAADGRIEHDHPVPCMVDVRGEARETSLSENLHRVAMNPADEFDAFAAIADDWMRHNATASVASAAPPSGEAIAYVARRFGVTVKHVEGRMRLAALAPEILQALRENALGLESAKAYAVTGDHALQRKVFKEQAKSSWKTHDPRSVRDALRGRTLALTDPRVIFVGLDAYAAAGGVIETEMFMGTEGAERVVSVALLEKLVKAQAESALAALAKAEGWKDALFGQGTGWNIRWPTPPKDFEKVHEYGKREWSKAEKKRSIAVFKLADDGKTLAYEGRFRPAKATASDARDAYKPETPEERAARLRAAGIALWSARLAAGSWKGTPLEGKALWPVDNYGIRQLTEQETADGEADGALVAVLIRVDQASIDAQREAGEAKYDACLAEDAERAAARQAAREQASDDDEGGEETDDDELEEGAA